MRLASVCWPSSDIGKSLKSVMDGSDENLSWARFPPGTPIERSTLDKSPSFLMILAFPSGNRLKEKWILLLRYLSFSNKSALLFSNRQERLDFGSCRYGRDVSGERKKRHHLQQRGPASRDHSLHKAKHFLGLLSSMKNQRLLEGS